MWIPPIISSYGKDDLTVQQRDDPRTHICEDSTGEEETTKCDNSYDFWWACWNLPAANRTAAECPDFGTTTTVVGDYKKVDETLGQVVAVNGSPTDSTYSTDVPVEGYAGSAFPPHGDGKGVHS